MNFNNTVLLNHATNVVRGSARIIWSEGGTGHDGIWREPGWVLPGGRRTPSEAEANAAADLIDKLTRAVGG